MSYFLQDHFPTICQLDLMVTDAGEMVGNGVKGGMQGHFRPKASKASQKFGGSEALSRKNFCDHTLAEMAKNAVLVHHFAKFPPTETQNFLRLGARCYRHEGCSPL